MGTRRSAIDLLAIAADAALTHHHAFRHDRPPAVVPADRLQRRLNSSPAIGIGACAKLPDVRLRPNPPLHSITCIMAKARRKPTPAEKAERRRKSAEFMTIFIKGKQKRVKRPQRIDGLDADEFIRLNADPLWLHQNEMWDEIEPMPGEPDAAGFAAPGVEWEKVDDDEIAF